MSERKKHIINDLFQVQNGYAFKSKDLLPEPCDNCFEVLKMGHIEKGGGLRKNPKKSYTQKSQKLKKYILNKNDIVMAMTDMKDNVVILGVSAIIKESQRYLQNQRVARLIHTGTEISDVNFLYYYLQGEDFIAELQSKANSGVQVNLSTKAIKESPILLPPLPEQKAIAGVLSSLDDKIDLLHQQNKTLEAMAETLFRQWFIEEAEDDWEDGFLPDEFDFTMGQSPLGKTLNEGKNGIPMFQGNADFGFRFPSNRVFTTAATRYAEKYDTLISVRAPVGAQNMASEKCCIGRGVAAFRYKKNPSFYTYTYYKMNSLIDEIKIFNDEGTVFGSISKKDFEIMEIKIPPMKYILEFEGITKPINDKIIFNSKHICNLILQRDILLPKLMNGEILVDVK